MAYINRFARIKYYVLAVCLVFTAAAFLLSFGLKLDPSLETRFIKDNKHLESYRIIRENFGAEPLLLVVWQPEGDLWSEENLSHLRILSEKIENLDHVKSVISSAVLLKKAGRENSADDIKVIKGLPLIRKLLIARDGKSHVLAVVPEKGGISPASGLALTKQIEKMMENGFVTGPLAIQSKAIELSRTDLFRMILIVSAVLLLLFSFSYRSWQPVVAAVIVVLTATAGACGIISLFDLRLSQFALIAIPILAVVCLEDVIHLMENYAKARRKGADSLSACRDMLFSCATPCIWTTITTAVGFASLLISDVWQVRSIGLLVLIGAPIGLAASLLVVPAFLLAAPPKFTAPAEGGHKAAQRYAGFLFRHARSLSILIIFSTIFLAYGIRFTGVRLDFPNIFRTDTAVQKQINYFDENLSGAASFEIMMEAKDEENFSSMKKLEIINALQLALSLTAPVVTTVSVIDVGLTAYIIKNGIPANPRELVKKAGNLIDDMRHEEESPLSAWLTPDLKKTRIHVRVGTGKQKYYDQLMSTLSYLGNGFRKGGVDVTWSGISLLYKEMERRMLHELILSFSIAFAGVLVFLIILFRSFKWGLLAMIPNILPIAATIGIMGWTGVDFSLALIILPAVGLGLIVDDTIHIAWGVRRYMREGCDMKDAVAKTVSTSGRALILTTVILSAGFASLAVSPFISNVELSIFVPVLLILALLYDLIGVPLLLLLWKKAGQNAHASATATPGTH